MVLLCAGAAAGLSGVWALSGLSERSALRVSPRVIAAAAVGLAGVGAVHFGAPMLMRGELGLPALFGLTGALALAAGAAKLDAALADRDGPRALRRASGLLVGSLLCMAAVAAVSLELVLTSLSHARHGWAYMLPSLASLLIVFAGRARLAGGAALALGARTLVIAAAGVLLLAGARGVVSPPASAPAADPARLSAAPVDTPLSAAPAATAPVEISPAPPVSASASASAPVEAPAAAAPVESASAPLAASAPAPVGVAGQILIESIAPRGILEADARGGVVRRLDKLQACLAESPNQSGTLTLKVGIDASGSVGYCRALGGDLVDTPLAACLLPAFYKMGFAAPASGAAHFEITLRAPAR